MSDDGKQQMYEQFAQVGKALGNPLRLLLLDLLSQAPRSVEELAGAAGAAVGNTSAQLQVLKAAGLVVGHRQGARIRYRLADDDVASVVAALMALADRHSAGAQRAAQRYLGERGQFPVVTADQLQGELASGRVVVVDVRPPVEYAAGHIPAARNIPPEDLEGNLAALPAGAAVVAYCRGPYCAYAPRLARLLATRGTKVSLLSGGLAHWRAANLPVEPADAINGAA